MTNLAVVGPPFRWNGHSIGAALVFPTRPFHDHNRSVSRPTPGLATNRTES